MDGKTVVRELGGFRLTRELGEGGMGKVFLARQTSLDRLIALKVLQPSLAADQEFLTRFLREARSAALFQHPNVVAVIDAGCDERFGVHYIAFEFVEGGSLEDLLDQRKLLPEEEALALISGVAQALCFAESKSIVHRDVKPDNILICPDGTPKLADLGLAKQQGGGDGTSVTQTGVVLGTPLYMAPEQALGEEALDIRADLYALGLCLWRMLTGLIPFNEQGTNSSLQILTKHINEELPDVRDRNPEVSEATARIIRGMSARDRDSRYRSAADLVKDLDRVLAGEDALGPAGAAAAPARRGSGSGKISGAGKSSGRRGAAAQTAVATAPMSALEPLASRSSLPVPLIVGVLVGALGIGVGVALGTREGAAQAQVAASPSPDASPAEDASPASSPEAPTPSGSAGTDPASAPSPSPSGEAARAPSPGGEPLPEASPPPPLSPSERPREGPSPSVVERPPAEAEDFRRDFLRAHRFFLAAFHARRDPRGSLRNVAALSAPPESQDGLRAYVQLAELGIAWLEADSLERFQAAAQPLREALQHPTPGPLAEARDELREQLAHLVIVVDQVSRFSGSPAPDRQLEAFRALRQAFGDGPWKRGLQDIDVEDEEGPGQRDRLLGASRREEEHGKRFAERPFDPPLQVRYAVGLISLIAALDAWPSLRAQLPAAVQLDGPGEVSPRELSAEQVVEHARRALQRLGQVVLKGARGPRQDRFRDRIQQLKTFATAAAYLFAIESWASLVRAAGDDCALAWVLRFERVPALALLQRLWQTPGDDYLGPVASLRGDAAALHGGTFLPPRLVPVEQAQGSRIHGVLVQAPKAGHVVKLALDDGARLAIGRGKVSSTHERRRERGHGELVSSGALEVHLLPQGEKQLQVRGPSVKKPFLVPGDLRQSPAPMRDKDAEILVLRWLGPDPAQSAQLRGPLRELVGIKEWGHKR
ncbi:MAG: protein kinase [Planctomycetota bacterium]